MREEFERIFDLKDDCLVMENLKERFKMLSKPAIDDFSYITDIYAWAKEYLEKSEVPKRISNPVHRKKFIFIILALYSPSTLVGYKIRIGLRDRISKVTGLVSTAISHNIDDLLFYYSLYASFQDDVDNMYGYIMERLAPRLVSESQRKSDQEEENTLSH